MEEDRALTRAIRLTQIQHMLHKNSKGLTTRELARLCGVCMRTIQRDLRDLETELKIPLAQEGDRYSILEGYVLPPVALSLFEALAVFLASRLCLRQTDKNNPHMQHALAKIAKVLPPPLAAQMGTGIESLNRKAANPVFVHVFEQVALALTTQRQMRIQYQSLQSNEMKEWLLEPYFVEMTGVGYSMYAIGHATREGRDGIITFKLDRIKSAEVLDTNFEIPVEVKIGKLLDNSWGIYWGEEIRVILKFSPRAVKRVKETFWHPSQTIEDLTDGSCLFKVFVSSVVEITPWIRGWGTDVEVLEPASLQEQFRVSSARLFEMYQDNQLGD